MIAAMTRAPRKTTTWDDAIGFRVWIHDPQTFYGDKPWRMIAGFQFLGDCLDYIASLQDRGVDCVYQSPAHTTHVKATDDRVVFKPAA
jgi:hypothetical protein